MTIPAWAIILVVALVYVAILGTLLVIHKRRMERNHARFEATLAQLRETIQDYESFIRNRRAGDL